MMEHNPVLIGHICYMKLKYTTNAFALPQRLAMTVELVILNFFMIYWIDVTYHFLFICLQRIIALSKPTPEWRPQTEKGKPLTTMSPVFEKPPPLYDEATSGHSNPAFDLSNTAHIQNTGNTAIVYGNHTTVFKHF